MHAAALFLLMRSWLFQRVEDDALYHFWCRMGRLMVSGQVVEQQFLLIFKGKVNRFWRAVALLKGRFVLGRTRVALLLELFFLLEQLMGSAQLHLQHLNPIFESHDDGVVVLMQPYEVCIILPADISHQILSVLFEHLADLLRYAWGCLLRFYVVVLFRVEGQFEEQIFSFVHFYLFIYSFDQSDKRYHLIMGGTPPTAAEERPLRSSHAKLASARLTNLNGISMIKITVPLQEKQYHQWAEQLLAFQKSTSKIMMPAKHTFTQPGACGQIGTADVYYPLFPYLLSDEIYDRRGTKRPFSEQELWYLLFSLAKAEQQNQPTLGPVGALCPNNIFLNEEGSIRVANRLSWPQSTAKIDKTLEDFPGYLSPQEMRNMQQPNQEEPHMEEAGEMFSLGLIVMSAGNLTDYSSLYNWGKGEFDEEKFMEEVVTWSRRREYSQVFRGVVVNLCSHSPQRRMDGTQLWELLSKHEESIAKKNNFIIDNASQKLHQGVREAIQLATHHPSQRQGLMQKRQRELDDYFGGLP